MLAAHYSLIPWTQNPFKIMGPNLLLTYNIAWSKVFLFMPQSCTMVQTHRKVHMPCLIQKRMKEFLKACAHILTLNSMYPKESCLRKSTSNTLRIQLVFISALQKSITHQEVLHQYLLLCSCSFCFIPRSLQAHLHKGSSVADSTHIMWHIQFLRINFVSSNIQFSCLLFYIYFY